MYALVCQQAARDVADDGGGLLEVELDVIDVVHDFVELLGLVMQHRRGLQGARQGKGGRGER